jgi:hypothetical protein
MQLHVLGHVHLTRQDQAPSGPGNSSRPLPPWQGEEQRSVPPATRVEDTALAAHAGLRQRAGSGAGLGSQQADVSGQASVPFRIHQTAPGNQTVLSNQTVLFNQTVPSNQTVSSNQTVPLSGKATALLTYLCLEGVAHHREHLAELLWDTPDPLRNLRVELAKLKQGGVVQFPERQPMLSFTCPVDLHSWLAAAQQLASGQLSSGQLASGQLTEEQLLPWLATLRGLPLSGLEDLGSLRYQQWLEGQRWAIGEQVERALGSVHGRLLREHRVSAAARIHARAEQLNLHLSEPTPAAEPRTGGDWQAVWPEQAQLRSILEQALLQPQLVLLSGRSGSGKRNLIRQGLQGSGWHLIQLQASSQRGLFQEALSQHLAQHIALASPAALQGPAPIPPPTDADAGLIELAATLGRSGLKLVIAVHHAGLGKDWLPDLARFLLDLPLPLVLILTETQAARLDEVREQAVFLDARRSHRLHMKPLTAQLVLRAWQEQAGQGQAGQGQPGQPVTSNETYARAVQLIQRSEGWPLHAQELSRMLSSAGPHAAGPHPHELGQHDLPEIVRGVLLGELSALPAPLRRALARLSLVHARIDAELAELLLGQSEAGPSAVPSDRSQGAQQTLMQGVQHGLLVPAAEHEHVVLPSLTHRSDDQTRWLQFGSEALRVALAGSLTGLERQELRQLLARHFLPTQPALSLNYALKAGLSEVAEAAQQALERARVPGPLSAPSPKGQSYKVQTLPAPPPLPGPLTRHEIRTPNGYRAALDAGQLEVTRHGWYGPPPLLTLAAGSVPDGPWSLTARLDVFRGAPHPGTGPASFALGLRSGAGPRQLYLPTGLHGTAEASSDGLAQFGGLLPLGEWFTLRGVGRAGLLELSVRALDVAFTIAALNWGGVDVLPVIEAAPRIGER